MLPLTKNGKSHAKFANNIVLQHSSITCIFGLILFLNCFLKLNILTGQCLAHHLRQHHSMAFTWAISGFAAVLASSWVCCVGLGIGTGANAAKKPKATASASSESAENKLTQVMVRLLLSVAMQTRILKAIIVRAFRISSACPLVAEVAAATKQYVAESKAYKDQELKEDAIGQPQHHALNAAMGVIMAAGEDPAADTAIIEYAKITKDMDTRLEGITPLKLRFHTMSQEVPHFRVARAFKSAHKKLEVNATKGTPLGDWVLLVLLPYLHKTDKIIRELEGVAPRGNLERVLQQYLDDGTVSWEPTQFSEE